MFPVKTFENFAWIVPTKLNYESIVDGRGSKSPSLLKMTPEEISEAAPRPAPWKRCLENTLINLLKFLAILQHKQAYKGSHF